MPPTPASMHDPLIGHEVEIHSAGGLRYCGVIRSIRMDRELGELFELGSNVDPAYRRLVYVTDRGGQLREVRGEA